MKLFKSQWVSSGREPWGTDNPSCKEAINTADTGFYEDYSYRKSGGKGDNCNNKGEGITDQGRSTGKAQAIYCPGRVKQMKR